MGVVYELGEDVISIHYISVLRVQNTPALHIHAVLRDTHIRTQHTQLGLILH